MEMDYPLHPPGTLVDTIYDVIKKEIAASHLKPGEKLNSRVLAERYQVSETPIKQALNRLITEGLVESIPRKGMRVRMISWAEIDEILELRLMLDLFFVSDVIKNLRENPELTEQLNNTILCQTACLDLIEDADYYNRTYELDNRFHELYIASSGNSKALEVFHNLNSHVYSLSLIHIFLGIQHGADGVLLLLGYLKPDTGPLLFPDTSRIALFQTGIQLVDFCPHGLLGQSHVLRQLGNGICLPIQKIFQYFAVIQCVFIVLQILTLFLA